MTDRVKGFVVSLQQDLRLDDDAEEVRQAIAMIKGVTDVKPLTTTSDDWLNRDRIRRELAEKLWKVLKDDA